MLSEAEFDDDFFQLPERPMDQLPNPRSLVEVNRRRIESIQVHLIWHLTTCAACVYEPVARRCGWAVYMETVIMQCAEQQAQRRAGRDA